MPFRLYVTPMLTQVLPKGTFRIPKYFWNTQGVIDPNTVWGIVGYGYEPWAVVGGNLSPADDATVSAEPDVQALPFDLSPNLTAPQVGGVHSFLESANIPAGWVSTADTWASVVRGVLGMFRFLQVYAGIYGVQTGTDAPSLFLGGVTLDTTFGSLALPVRTAMLAAAAAENIPTTGLTGSTTLRVILRTMADAYSTRVYTFNDGTPNGHTV